MALVAMFLSGIFGAISNFCLRKNIEKKGSIQAFFFLQLLITGVVLFFLFPVRRGVYYGHPLIFGMAIIAGLMLKFMKTSVGKALRCGPSGMSFAIVNAASLFPVLFLYLAFSHTLFLTYTRWHLISSILIGIGLFWAGYELSSKKYNKKEWMRWIFIAFLCHIVYLLIKEWRCILFQGSFYKETFFFFRQDHLDSLWFAPWIFFSSAIFHGTFFIRTERRLFTSSEWGWGILGGIWNGICSFFFTLGPEIQQPHEAALLFPMFAITLIFACNLWSQHLYKEKVHWWANSLCFVGLFIGSIGHTALEKESPDTLIVKKERDYTKEKKESVSS